jgi:hypothetical protein
MTSSTAPEIQMEERLGEDALIPRPSENIPEQCETEAETGNTKTRSKWRIGATLLALSVCYSRMFPTAARYNTHARGL